MDRSDLNAHIGRRLRIERRLRDLTQKQMAAICGVSFQQIQKYETGIVTISAATLWTLAEALGIGVAEFFPHQDHLTAPRGARLRAG